MARQQELEATRKTEMQSQKSLHVFAYPYVHTCNLAATDELQFCGERRSETAPTCEKCHRSPYPSGSQVSQPIGPFCVFTCDACNMDWCGKCFKSENRSPAEKTQAAQKEQERARQMEEDWEREARKELDAECSMKLFPKNIICPTARNKVRDGSGMKGFTVWTSGGYSPDGFHSYHGPPEKEFDSTYLTVEEANLRARYIFYHKNAWGLSAKKMHEAVPDVTYNQECITFKRECESVYTVSVVSDANFESKNSESDDIGAESEQFGHGLY